MKIALLSLCSLFLAATGSATVRTVSNYIGQPAQYTNIQTAITASSAGDTLYIMGSPVQYPSTSIDKQLTIIGAGYYGVLPAHGSNINQVYIYAAAAGTRIIGVDCSYMYWQANDVIVERAKVNEMYFTANIQNNVIRHSYLGYVDVNHSQALLISNNVFYNINNYPYYNLLNSSASNVIITNNIFMGYTTAALFTVSNALVTNNIFWGSTPNHVSVTNCTFTKNLTFLTSNNTIPFGTNVGSGNFVGMNPQFVNAPLTGINYTYNYQLGPSSPGKNTGTDGTDLGIYGGVAPMPNIGGQPPIPLITFFNLQYNVVPQGGSLNVQVKAKKID